jgi:hypothetical protein
MHRLEESLSAQQISLIKAAAREEREFLTHSYYVDGATGRRTALGLEGQELNTFVERWQGDPVATIRFINEAVSHIERASRQERYLAAAVELEILMDRECPPSLEEGVGRGIPTYLVHGYTDMGALSRHAQARERFRVDKDKMRQRLLEARRQALATGVTPESLLLHFYGRVRHEVEVDEPAAWELFQQCGDQTIALSQFLERGVGVCRHLAIIFHLYLQEVGIAARVVKGDLRFMAFQGRHAWNVAFLGDSVTLIDVTLPDVEHPFVLKGRSEEEVYALAATARREYQPTSDEENFYKINAPP